MSDGEIKGLVRRRLANLREANNVSQETLAHAMGMNSRQSLAEVEAGNRAIQPKELISAAQFFGVSYTYFTDPLELAGEAKFSWRKSAECKKESIDNFESTAGKWIAIYRYLGSKMVASVNSSLPQVALSEDSTFDEAYREGSNVAIALELGEIPACKMAITLTEKLGILILFLDICPEISGAACKLGPFDTIMINRNETPARRNFDIAHELFHLITWAIMPPDRIEDIESKQARKPKVEQLADAFASGLLMPEASILKYIQYRGVPDKSNAQWIKDAAVHFRVSGPAMKWRLVSLGYFSHTIAKRIDDSSISVDFQEDIPQLFSKPFMARVEWAIKNGEMSVRKIADLLRITIDDLKDLFSSHGLIAPFDL